MRLCNQTHWFGQSPSALQSGYPREQLPGSLHSGNPDQPPIDWQRVFRSCTRFASEDSQLPSSAIGVMGVLTAQRQQDGLALPLPLLLALPSWPASARSTAAVATAPMEENCGDVVNGRAYEPSAVTLRGNSERQRERPASLPTALDFSS